VAPGFIYRHLAAGPAKGGLYAFYDIATELGKGSFATVVKAINRADGRWYAVKMIQNSKVKRITPTGTGGANNPNEIFVREISILEDLKHPNICQLKEVFWDATTISKASLQYLTYFSILQLICRSGPRAGGRRRSTRVHTITQWSW
jgi:serine/threonine/tyrosine protein kinase RAD53